MQLHNTLTGKKEEFKPIRKGEVSMYSCGPTVYDRAHIGNLRAYVFTDTLRRALEYTGNKVKQVMNVTDVGHLVSDSDEGEDKMVKALRRENKPFTLAGMREISDIYTKVFVDDIKELNIKLPHEMPRASDHIQEDIELVRELEKNGYAYKISDGIYFDISKFPDYGKLGNINLAGLKAGARVEVKTEKRNAIDFNLWKLSTNDLGWDSPWGKGFPGWHIECSAMSREYLGQPFDIHTGGIDHIPTHHQNEIAQSEAAYGVPLAHYWLHNEHLILQTGKIGKSLGNSITLADLKNEGIRPLSYRYWLMTAHYRTPVIFSVEAVKSAEQSYVKLLLTLSSIKETGRTDMNYSNKFLSAIENDLNMPIALSLVWEILKDPNLEAGVKKATILDFDNVLGLDLNEQSQKIASELAEVPDEVKNLLEKRSLARDKKNWNEADAIRSEVEDLGYEIFDTDSGPVARKKIV